MPPRKTNQPSLLERVIEDPELEQMIVTWIETKEAAKAHDEAHKVLYERVNGMNLAAGESIRVGEFVIPIVSRRGGDVTIPAWEKVGIGKIARAGSGEGLE